MKKTNKQETFITQIESLEDKITEVIKMMSDVERVMLKHEQAMLAFQNDIAELKRKQKNSYGVV